MFMYCKRCGLIVNKKSQSDICDVCETQMDKVPDEYLTSSKFMFISREKRIEFEEKIKQNSEYDAQLAADRDVIIKQKEEQHKAEVEEKVVLYNQNKVRLTCPVCHSENITKISNIGKVVKVGAFGILGAGDIGKKYKCNLCGCKF